MTSSSSASLTYIEKKPGVLPSALMKFLFPPHLEHPESTGRLDVFAHYGPCDDEGQLRGGKRGSHIVNDVEVRTMVHELNETLLYELFLPRPKATVKVMVDEILPKAIRHCYSEKAILRMLSVLAQNEGRWKFHEIQDLVFKDQRRRLLTLVHGGDINPPPRKPIPYQTGPAKVLSTMVRKKKLLPPQEFMVKGKMLHQSGGLIAPVEMQNLSMQLSNNIRLLRDVGDLDDKWDRYCALRQSGKSSYVKARNDGFSGVDKFGEGAKCGGGASDLKASLSLHGPRHAPPTGRGRMF